MADERPLYERDPAAWRAHLAEGNARQPRKRVGVDVLLRDERGDILLVDPRYKPDWDLPGGMAEANESPRLTAERELREELGLRLRVGPLLVVDWVAPHGPWDDSLMFVFDGGVVPAPQELRPTDDELRGCRFASLEQARTMLRPYVWERLRHAADAARDGCPRYLTNGAP
ncbi:NUDIX domain-containing protein [Micromonospora sp. NPDC000089]|uniref:NUDIX domain-containing protein n=1 Tax=unclassified Micromonospora TaxID=2617518 RepID=UPI0036C007D0